MERLWIFMCLLTATAASHFRGGIIKSSPLNNEHKTMEITFFVSYRRNHVYAAKCDENIISEGKEVGTHPEGQGLKCVKGCPESNEHISSIRYVCTDFSSTDDWEYGQRTFNHSFPDSTSITLSARGCCWIAPFGEGDWDLFIRLGLLIRPDINRINSSPYARFFPVIQIPEGCNSSIVITPYDPDGDVVRCRWGTGTECSGICNGFPDAVLDEATCTLTSQGTGVGYKAVALMMEDFSVTDTLFQNPFSTVALNFLVYVYSSNLNCSASAVKYISPTPLDGSCIAIAPESTYTFRIVIDAYISSITVDEIQTLSPVGVSKSQLQRVMFSNEYFINMSWTPKPTDYYGNNNNIESICFSAIVPNVRAPGQRCIKLMAGVNPPRVVPDSVKPRNILVHPVNPTFDMMFDQNIVRPIHSYKLIIKDTLRDKEVYSVRVGSEQGGESIQFLPGNKVQVITNVNLEEKRNFSVMLEQGFVRGTIGCGPQSASFPEDETWEFETMDITPPVLTFLKSPKRSNGTTLIEWKFDEAVKPPSCFVSTRTGEVVSYCNTCSESSWFCTGQIQGLYDFHIKVRDIANNEATFSWNYEVDLTPPVVKIKPPFQGNSSNMRSVEFNLECPLKEFCTYECSFGEASGPKVSVDCGDGTLTEQIQNEGEHELIVRATDNVGNRGENMTFRWIADFTPPVILNITDAIARCDDDLDKTVPLPTVYDTVDKNPKFEHIDEGDRSQCEIKRTWTVRDSAGNIATRDQMISLTLPLVISLQPRIRIPCDPNVTVTVPQDTASADNACARKVTLHFVDSELSPTCPSEVNRTWYATDDCNPTIPHTISSQGIIFYSICPASSCGRNHQPPRGTCVEGSCLCYEPWNGDNCNVELYKPEIKPIDVEIVLREGEVYKDKMEVLKGTEPIYWMILDGPTDLRINQTTGLLEWQANSFHKLRIEVSASNDVGTDKTSWNISVIPGYSTELYKLQTTTYFRSVPVTMTGRIIPEKDNLIESLLNGYLPVEILIEYRDSTRMYRTGSSPDGMFSFTFEPSELEYGSYKAKSKHPGASSTSPPIDWRVLGMKLRKYIVTINDEVLSNVDKTYRNISEIINDGPEALEDVKVVSVRNVPDDVQVELSFNTIKNIPLLAIGERVALDIKLTAARPFGHIRVYFVLQSKEGVRLNLILNAYTTYSEPLYVIRPNRLRVTIVRGGQTIVQVDIANEGRREATGVHLDIPRVEYLSVIRFGNSSYSNDKQNIPVGKMLSLVLQISAREDSRLGRYINVIAIRGNEIQSSLSIDLRIISNAKATVTFRVEDEFTYFAETNPLVMNARVRIYNNLRGISLTQEADSTNGLITFRDIPEGTYEVYVQAPKHEDMKDVQTFKPGSSSKKFFLKRTAVTYRWTVTPTDFKDVYRINVQADFATRIPMPVITVTPNAIDLEPYELGLKSSMELVITNHGLIRAEAFSFRFPKNHPTLEFKIVAGFRVLNATTSRTLAIRVCPRDPGQSNPITCGDFIISITFGYVCGGPVNRTITVRLYVPPKPCPGHTPRYTGVPAAGYARICCQAVPSGRSVCNPCLQSLINCLWMFHPLSRITCVLDATVKVLAGEAQPVDILGFISCAMGISRRLGSKGSRIAFAAYDCVLDMIEACTSVQGSRDQVTLDFAKSVEPLNVLVNWLLEFFGNQVWLSSDNDNWLIISFIPAVSDQSEEGEVITQTEYNMIMTGERPLGITKQDVTNFLMRWNATVFDWRNGKIEPTETEPNRISYSKFLAYKLSLLKLNKEAQDAGFKSVIDQYNSRVVALNEITSFEEEEGICAVVRVKIEQELALTREGFTAKLEIDNGEIATLREIDVAMRIKDAENGKESSDLFSIGNATVGGDMKTDRSLAVQRSGELVWLIIPYSEAAPSDDKDYDVGGTLYYVVNGHRVTVPLLPARITVKPDPLLFVHYFWEKFVISDDPFTAKVESAIPFSLAVAVKNEGNGTAHNLRITSGQPEIVENEKGLLINFKMIGASIGKMSVTPSLTVRFGDISHGMTVIAYWWMVSSLRGMFLNYNATFENENPLGDPRLSLIEEVEVHELIHYVRIVEGDIDDGTNDFLVNDVIDYNVRPDSVFSSYSLMQYDVHFQNISLISEVSVGTTVTFLLEASPSKTGFSYYRFETHVPVTEHVSVNSFSFDQTVSTTRALPTENAWFTSMIGERDSEVLIGHIFAYSTNADIMHQYNITVNLTTIVESLITLRPMEPVMNVTLRPDIIIARITKPPSQPQSSEIPLTSSQPQTTKDLMTSLQPQTSDAPITTSPSQTKTTPTTSPQSQASKAVAKHLVLVTLACLSVFLKF